MLQVVEAAEELPIRVFHPALAHLLVRQIVAVLQVGQSNHQPCRLARTSERVVIQQAEFGLEALPVDQLRQADQWMFQIELVR